MPSDRHTHRGRRSRAARERRALVAAINASPSLGIREQREGRFYVNHERKVYAAGEHVPDEPPLDPYFTGVGVYVEYCDRCRFVNDNPNCSTCGGRHEVRRIHGRRPA